MYEVSTLQQIIIIIIIAGFHKEFPELYTGQGDS